MSQIYFEIIPVNKQYKSEFAEESLKLMQQINEVPCEYISHMVVTYHNGDTIFLEGEIIKHPIPISEEGVNSMARVMKDTVKSIKVYLDVELLESDVEDFASQLFGSGP